MAGHETMGFLTESSLLPKKAKPITGTGDGSMAALRSLVAAGAPSDAARKRSRPSAAGDVFDALARKRQAMTDAASSLAGAHRHQIITPDIASDTLRTGLPSNMRRAGIGALPAGANEGLSERNDRDLAARRSDAAFVKSSSGTGSSGSSILELKSKIYAALTKTGGASGSTIASSLAEAGVQIHALPAGLRRTVETALAEEARVLGIESPAEYVASAITNSASMIIGSGERADSTLAVRSRSLVTAASAAASRISAQLQSNNDAAAPAGFLVDFEQKRWDPEAQKLQDKLDSTPGGIAAIISAGSRNSSVLASGAAALASGLEAAVQANAARMTAGRAQIATGGVRSQWEQTLSHASKDYLREIVAETEEARAQKQSSSASSSSSVSGSASASKGAVSLDSIRNLLASAVAGTAPDKENDNDDDDDDDDGMVGPRVPSSVGRALPYAESAAKQTEQARPAETDDRSVDDSDDDSAEVPAVSSSSIASSAASAANGRANDAEALLLRSLDLRIRPMRAPQQALSESKSNLWERPASSSSSSSQSTGRGVAAGAHHATTVSKGGSSGGGYTSAASADVLTSMSSDAIRDALNAASAQRTAQQARVAQGIQMMREGRNPGEVLRLLGNECKGADG